jgi:hypothetical protein
MRRVQHHLRHIMGRQAGEEPRHGRRVQPAMIAARAFGSLSIG